MRTITKTITVVVISLLCLFLLVLSVMISSPQQASSDENNTGNALDSTASTDINLPQLQPYDKGNYKLESALSQLVIAEVQGQAIAFAQQNGISLEANKVRVILEANPDRTQQAIESAQALGGDIETTYRNLVQVKLPISGLNDIANNQDIDFVRRPLEPMADVTIESMGLINASTWNSAGYSGSGVKVGILDSGFSGYSSLLGTDLPSSVTTWWAPSIGGPGSGIHGSACAEIIHDIAPNASIYLANFGTDVEWGNAIDWLISQGVNIISCSIGWMNAGPGNGTGTICSGVADAASAGILWANSAGNAAQSHWRGTWSDGNGNSWLDFSTGDETNKISVSAGESITVGLKWNDTWGASSNNYNLYLMNSSLGIVARSENTQSGSQSPTEIIINYYATYTGLYHIAVHKYSASGTAQFDLFTFNQDLQYQTAQYSLMQPADSPNAVTVGAVYWNNKNTIEVFSSQGPTTDSRTKPDIVAPDGVSTVTYGAGNFYGTSAAAPHVAGAAALVKQRFPSYNRSQIQTYLENNAVDLGASGKDNIYGSGRLDLHGYHILNINSNPTNGGATTGSGTYLHNSIVSINATANSSYYFVNWSGNTYTIANVSSPSTTLTMNETYSITANFASGCTIPGTPASPSPANNSTGVSVDADLDWSDCVNASYYQVYFGTSPSPSTLVGSPNSSSWTLPNLNFSATYYWKIVARNSCGNTSGPIWRFMVEDNLEQTTVSVSPLSRTVCPNTSFNVSVYVTPGEPIAGMQFDLSFNASLLHANSVTQGNLLNQDGCTAFFCAIVPYTIDNIAGTVRNVSGGLFPVGCNVSNPGMFANISFTANATVSGTSFLNLSNVIVGDPNGSPVSISVSNGSVRIPQRWDTNCDGSVNVLDMIRIGQHWGQAGSPGWIPEDVNKDGAINVLDMIVIGQHWTG